MGTQQLLLIVLGVIIVGIAIAVGITIFNNQAYNNNRQAVATELNTYGTTAMQWWKTPVAQGGAGRNGALLDAATIAKYVGFGSTANSVLETSTGKFTINSVATADTSVAIWGIGTDKKGAGYPLVKATVNLVPGTITVDAAGVDADGAF